MTHRFIFDDLISFAAKLAGFSLFDHFWEEMKGTEEQILYYIGFFFKLYHYYKVIQLVLIVVHTKIRYFLSVCPLFFMLLRKSFLMLSAFPLYEGIKRRGKLDLVICYAPKSKNVNVMYYTFE